MSSPTESLLVQLHDRIAAMGDMPIPVASGELFTLLTLCGQGALVESYLDHMEPDEEYEIPALALEALILIGRDYKKS